MGEARALKLRYTKEAMAELQLVLGSIAESSPSGAKRVQARIQAAVNRLIEYPHSGQFTGLKTMRRVVATPYPYLVFYKVDADEVVIIGVRHAARRPID